MIEWGTTARQRCIRGALEDIARRAAEANLQSPAVVVVGEVAGLRDGLRWYEELPLFGCTVIVTRAREQSAEFEAQLRARGAEVYCCPVIRIQAVDDTAELDAAIESLPDYDWVILTSVNGVDHFWQRLAAVGKDSRALSGVQVAAVGSATADALRQRGITPDLVPDHFRQEGLLDSLDARGDVAGRRFLYPGAEGARERLANGLRERGAEVDAWPLYRTVSDTSEGDRERIQRAVDHSHTVLTFASSSAVRGFVDLMGRDWPSANRDRLGVACIGPLTRRTAQEAGFQVGIEPERSTINDLIRAIEDHIKNTR